MGLIAYRIVISLKSPPWGAARHPLHLALGWPTVLLDGTRLRDLASLRPERDVRETSMDVEKGPPMAKENTARLREIRARRKELKTQMTAMREELAALKEEQASLSKGKEAAAE